MRLQILLQIFGVFCIKVVALGEVINSRNGNDLTCEVLRKGKVDLPIYLYPPVENVNISSTSNKIDFKFRKEWEKVNAERPLHGPITDIRWQYFPTLKGQEFKLILDNNVKTFAFSVCTLGTLKLLFPTKTSITEYSLPKSNPKAAQERCEWKHYAIKISKMENNKEDRIVTVFENYNALWNKTISSSVIGVASDKLMYWKNHNYSFLRKYEKSNSSLTSNIMGTRQHDTGQLCISFFVAVNTNSILKVSLSSGHSKNYSVITLETPSELRSWQNVRLNISAKGESKLSIIGTRKNVSEPGYWAIDEENITNCSSKNETYRFQIKDKSVICKELTVDEQPGNLGCKNNSFGINCDKKCPENCQQCHHDNGCTSCRKGYFGRNCSPCPMGFYGDKCKVKCSSFCEKCDSVEGCTSCKKGYFGRNCSPCPMGFYGDKCKVKCSSFCEKCDNVEGCTSCKKGYFERNCSPCRMGFYGDKCIEKCSTFCEKCDNVEGCTSCKKGYFGLNAYSSKNNSNHGFHCNGKCPQKCKKCDRADGCISCIDGQFFGLNCSETFYVINTTDKKISIKWDKPQAVKSIIKYTLKYRIQNDKNSYEKNIVDRQATIESLKPYRTYHLTLYAILENGINISASKLVATAQGKHIWKSELPKNVTFYGDKCKVKYSSFCEKCDNVEGCTSCKKGYFGLNVHSSKNNSDHGLHCKGKCPEKCKKCDPADGCISCIDGQFFGLNCSETFSEVNITYRTISIKWDTPQTVKKILKYTLKYGIHNDEDSLEMNNVDRQATIESLRPYRTYNLTLYAILENGINISASKVVATAQGKNIWENELPKNVTFIKKNTLNLTFDCQSLRGELNLTITLRCLSDWCVRDSTRQSLKMYINFTSCKANYEVIIHELPRFTKYIINVTATRQNADKVKMYGPRTSPPGEPYEVGNLTIEKVSHTEIYLKWQPPYPPTGNISKYIIYIVTAKSALMITNSTIKPTSVCSHGTNFICFHASNLTDNTKYNFTVEAINENVKKSSKAKIQAQTDQRAPEIPSNLQLIWNDSTKKVDLSWQHPVHRNSPLQSFNITIKIENNTTNEHLNIAKNNKTNFTFAMTLRDYFNYTINIVGRNKYTGRQATVIVRKFPSIPNSVFCYPIIEQCTNSQCSLPFLDCKNVSKEFKTLSSENSALITNNKKQDCENFLSINDKNKSKVDYSEVHFGGGVGIIYSATGGNYYCSFNEEVNDESSLGVITTIILFLIIGLSSCGYLIWAYMFNKFPFNTIKERSTRGLFKNASPVKLCTTTVCRPKKEDPQETFELLVSPIYECVSRTLDSKPINVKGLEDYLMNCFEEDPEENELKRQFENVPKILPDQERKYDSTRVILKNNDDGDYINANYIDGYQVLKAFIATQAPTNETIDDFWLMVFQENVTTIVMMTELFENGVKKCEQYWPEHSSNISFRKVVVHTRKVDLFPDYIFRQLELTCGDSKRLINHLQFTTWPDHGVPLYLQSLVPLLRKLLTTPQNTPIVVHCNAGCGRTGTIILCDIALRMAAKEEKIDFLKILSDIRKQRVPLVNSVEQYIFAHLVVLECLCGKDFSIPITEAFESEVYKILRKTSVKPIMDELDKVMMMFEKKQKPSRFSISDDDKLKNRLFEILPGRTQVFLSPRNGSSYINAIKVDCYRCPKKFIVTQQPLPTTVEDFWRLVKEFEISTIVSLNEIDENDPECPKFWTETDKELVLNQITIKTTDKTENEAYETMKTKITFQEQSENDKILHVIQMKNWKRETPKPVKASELIIVCKQMFKSSLTSKGPILVTCYDGCTASGLFVALAYLIEKIKMEQRCDVFSAIRTVRQSRIQFVQDYAQVELLYKLALEYTATFEDYQNFSEYDL